MGGAGATIVGLAGKAGSGKDTVGYYFAEQYGMETLAFADPLRRGLMAMFGLDEPTLVGRTTKDVAIEWLGVSPRRLLQTLGTEWGRDMVRRDLWLLLARRRIEQIMARPPAAPVTGVVVTDVRFDNEADMLRDMGGVILHVVRPGADGGADHHISEGGIRRVSGDRVVSNTGTVERLWASLDGLMSDLLDNTKC